MPIEYAHALSRSLENITNSNQAEMRVEELVAVLKKDGKMRALPAILREFERIEARKFSQKPTLTLARQSDIKKAVSELQKYTTSPPSDIETKIDERLVGGWRYTNSDTLIDASHKSALLELYRRVTTR